ncbi:predicted protein [Histoplasma mississippiense (nom. inval.)]|uniref:predicted protein n=1 Tax=Ajellomyces capsulatus (strain NAm1 / WU24) TaxID=2059318 RepID=UPI000157CAAB|nr:predicted protein [Histoplasma mississippiense (nom. inval.)]EDN09321.1 predicted protein [Histoplasma mississippiense (nom. inval.)]
MVVDERDDPLVKALPPETDYLTYLTILEYQLTRERLPILHNLLQDEKLTVNIGWDLVQLLLPMMPASQECLQDVARLGNPREVILRVCNSLMKLEPVQDEDGDDMDREDDRRLSEAVGEVKLEEEPRMNDNDENADDKSSAATSNVPVHVLQFNCLLSMLSVLHSRIQTRYPSRFVATSLQAVLEAYTAFPTVETTAAVLEFFRDIAGKKRPRLPPRNTSESILLTQSAQETTAPDPEAESHPGTVGSEESALINRLMQFGLIELLKTYLLHCVNATPAGMLWALRLQEKLDTRNQMHSSLSLIGAFGKEDYLKERDMTVGKIIALSRDFGIETNELLDIISKPGDQQPPPLDFEETPKHAEDIHLQRHGCLLLLAARSAADKLLSSGQPVKAIPVFPDLAAIYSHFLGEGESPYSVVMEEPEALVDSLFVRFNLIRQILEDEDLQYAREPAIGWLKEDLLAATTPNVHPGQKKNPFIDPTHFAILFPRIYEPIPDDWLSLGTAKTDHPINTWLTFTQHLLPYHLAILNLYYFLTQSATLYKQLQIQELHPAFESKFLAPLRTFVQQISTDAEIKARVEMEIGNEAEQVGQGAAELMLHIIGEIEDASAGLLVNAGQEGSSN